MKIIVYKKDYQTKLWRWEVREVTPFNILGKIIDHSEFKFKTREEAKQEKNDS